MGIIVDLSKYQGTIDFAKLAKVVDGVILRVQAGSSYADPKYQEYATGCKANGIKFGTYSYFKGISVNDAIQEAKDCLARTDKDSLFTVVDIEAVSMNDLVAGGQAFIDYLKQNGVAHVGIYSGESFYKTYNLGNIRSDFQWIAKYGTNDGQQHTPPSLPEDDLWQYTSVGKLDGINGNVDLNVVTNHVEFPFFDKPVVVVAPISIYYQAHIQEIGWQGWKRDGETAGTTGQAKRMEALTIHLANSDAVLTIEGHVQNYGWTAPRTNGEVVGTVGSELRLEAVKISCDKLNILYRGHVQEIGWQDWVKNGEVAGTTGKELRLEAIEIKLA
jgi:GH25 family lysozyme M1 (1,4-beta-N-acetylmuramidase)